MKNILRSTSLVIEPLESRIAPAVLFSQLATDLKGQLDKVQLYVDTFIAAGSLLPVVGDKLKDAGKVIDSFSEDLRHTIDLLSLNPNTDSDVQTAIFNLLRPDAVNPNAFLRLLADNTGDGAVTAADVVITHPGGDNTIELDLNLHAMVGVSKSLAFDVGLGSLPIRLESNAGVQVAATLDYHHLNFGISDRPEGFYFNTGTMNEISVGLTAGLTPGSDVLIATIGFLRGKITDGASDDVNLHTQFSASLVVDLTEGGVNSHTFKVAADVALKLDAGFSDSFPSIGADFRMHYGGFDGSDSAPTVEFKNVRVNLGETISGLLEPILKNIEPLLKPIEPVIDFVTAPIPVVSDLSHAGGGSDVSLLDVAGVVAGQAPPQYQQLFQLAATIVEVLNFANDFKANPQTKQVSINMGNFLALAASGPNDDLRGVEKALDAATAPDGVALAKLVVGGAASGFDLNAKIDEAVAIFPELAGSSLVTDLKSKLDMFLHPNGIDYAFPFLTDPAGAVFGMLLGQDADLFTLDVTFKASGGFSHTYPTPLAGVDVRQRRPPDRCSRAAGLPEPQQVGLGRWWCLRHSRSVRYADLWSA